MFNNVQIILASASPRRAELLRKAGVSHFDVIPSNAPETDSPSDNAARKAHAIALSHTHAYVIGADTVIRFQNQIIGKPRDLDDARRILSLLSGNTHEVVTGVCICNPSRKFDLVFDVATQVVFNKLSPQDIERYLSLVPVLDKAGAYAIQDHGDIIISHIVGDYDNVIGLPTAAVIEAIADNLKLLC